MDEKRFNPCNTDACKERCDNFGVRCEEICIDEIESLRARVAELEESQKTWNEYYRRQHHPRCDLLEAAGTDSLGNKCTCQQCIKEDVLGALKASQCEPVAWIKPEWLSGTYLGALSPVTTYPEIGHVPLYTSSPTIPEGWKLVPIEPTDEMYGAWFRAVDSEMLQFDDRYSAILAAAPEYKGDTHD